MKKPIEEETMYQEETPLWQEALLVISVIVVSYFLLLAIALI